MATTLKKGMVVQIRNQTLSGKEVREGEATLVLKASGFYQTEEYETWFVRFTGDEPHQIYQRRIFLKDGKYE